jgi:ribonuclease HII
MEIDFLTILTQAGSAGIVGAMFIAYMYFDSKKKRETLVIKDTERKTDTDEVARQLNNEQEVCIAKMEKDIEFIKLQVSNHLPTAMKELMEKLDKHIEKQNLFERDILVRLK